MAGADCRRQPSAISRAYPAQALLLRLGMCSERAAWAERLPPAVRALIGEAPPEAAWSVKGAAARASPSADDLGGIRLNGRVWVLARQAQGCRWVQRALENASTEGERRVLAMELRSHVVEASRCPHANHVLQRCIGSLRPEALDFVIEEIVDASACQIARHKYGCRIVQRLVEQCPPAQIRAIADAILADLPGLSVHAYGTFTVQNLFANGSADDRLAIQRFVLGAAAELCAAPHGAAVVAAVVESLDSDGRRALLEGLASEPAALCAAACSRGAPLVVRALEELRAPQRRRLAAALRERAQAIAASPHGRGVMERLGSWPGAGRSGGS